MIKNDMIVGTRLKYLDMRTKQKNNRNNILKVSTSTIKEIHILMLRSESRGFKSSHSILN